MTPESGFLTPAGAAEIRQVSTGTLVEANGTFDTIPPRMPIDIDIAHVARLARLGLSSEELEQYRLQLGLILEHAARVQQVDTAALQPTAHPLGLTNGFREDEIRPSLNRAEVLSQAPAHQDGYFVVPPALEAP